MNNFIFLLGTGIIAFIIINPIIGYFINNRVELDDDKERELTESYK